MDTGLYTRNMARAPSLSEDLGVSYRVSLVRIGEASRATWVAELDGPSSTSARGATPEDAIRQALAGVDVDRDHASDDVSEAAIAKPPSAGRHSGKLLVRMPATLHDELARAAELEGVSLNQLITGALAAAVEWRAEGTDARTAGAGGSRLTTIAIAANLAVVSLLAIVALALLVIAWRDGF